MNSLKTNRTSLSLLPLLLASALLVGCGASDEAEINSWMAEVQKNTKVNVKPLSEPKTFMPFAYGVREETDSARS